MSGRLFYGLLAVVIVGGLGVGFALDPAKLLPKPGTAGSKAAAGLLEKAIFRTDTTLDQGKDEPGPNADELKRNRTPCPIPLAAPDETVVLFSAGASAELSAVAIGGTDTETTASEVVIEPGAKPLYLIMANGDSAIWRFTGAAERVTHLVLLSDKVTPQGAPLVGSVGVAPARITQVSGESCFRHFDRVNSHEAKVAIDHVTKTLGRAPDVVGGVEVASLLQFPSAKAGRADHPPVAPPGFDPKSYRVALNVYPGGVVDYPGQTVVSPVGTTPYEILPGYMGIAQLQGRGDIIQNMKSPANRGLVIVKPIDQFPVNLGPFPIGLRANVRAPANIPPNSCIVDETTGDSLDPSKFC